MSRHSGALAPGWGSTLGAALRGSSSKAIVARALREALRASRREALVAIAAAPATAEQPRHVVRETASDQRPRLRIGQLVAGGHRPELAMPSPVLRVIAAADRIATMPYRYGGGHGNFDDSGYDCSGSVSYALHGGGLLDVTLASGAFMSWGEPGPGRWITIYAAPGHMFMVVAGRRFDTSGRGQTGSRWQPGTRGAEAGYVVRHPAGL